MIAGGTPRVLARFSKRGTGPEPACRNDGRDDILKGAMMQKRHWIPIAGLTMSMALGANGALAAQDGTGGPEMATPNPSLCDRDLISEEAFAAFATPTGAFFSDAIEPVDAASIAGREPADAETVTEIEATLRSYEACVVRDGAIGAYAFLNPEMELVELIYLGVSAASFDTATETPDPDEEGMPPVQPRADMTPQQIVQLEDGRIGVVIVAPQPGTDQALLTMVETDGVWIIEHVAPILQEGETPSESGGGGGP
jgi:hypothetical protein